MIKQLSVSAALLFSACISFGREPLSYKDPALPVEERVRDLMQRMTVEEKIAQIRQMHSWDILSGQKVDSEKLSAFCGDNAYGFVEAFPLTSENLRDAYREIQSYLIEETRLGIPAFTVAESLHGVVHEGATVFPQSVALGSTFNPGLAYEKSRCTAGELNTLGIRQVFAPCLDVARELRWGRCEETYGEDPFLNGTMAIAEVTGYMDHGIEPMLKHYGPHGTPSGGLNLAQVECGTRDLFDIYLKPFEMVIANTPVRAVMSSYNSWNRTPNSASKYLLTDILRGRFGFDGYVYSDWGAIDMLHSFHHAAADDGGAGLMALLAGLDVEASSDCFPLLADKVESGELDISYIDRAVERVLRAKFKSGLFEDPYQENARLRLPLRDKESVALSRRIADESTVLLKNEGGLLPLDASKLKSIAVIGPNADKIQFGDYTWSKNKADGVTPLQGLQKLVGDKVKINYAAGCSIASLDTGSIAEAVEAARRSDVAVIFVGSSSTAFVRNSPEPSTSGEGIDLHDISLTGAQEELVEAVVATGRPVVVVLVAGKPFAIPWIKEHVPAVIAQWYAGEQQGNSIADILFGNVNPSGKLNYSFPQSTGHLPCHYNHLPTDRGYYRQPGSYSRPGRDYVFATPEPLWAFGHGLSYTSFGYPTASTDKTQYMEGDTIKVSVTVGNTGHRAGKEVVQVYVHDVYSSVVTPVKQLKGFRKVALEAGRDTTVLIPIAVSELMLTADDGRRFLEAGDFEILVGTASDSISHTLPVRVGCVAAGKNGGMTAKAASKTVGRSMTVKGSIRDIQATPVAGVQVSDEYGNRAVSDSKGDYTITTKSNTSLTFSKQGFSTKCVAVEGRGNVSLQLSR